LIIGLTGKKGSGKDTAAKYLVDNYGYERKAFADSLKQSVAALFDIPFEKVDEYKVDLGGTLPHVEVIIDLGEYREQPGYGRVLHHTQYSMSWREFLQRYGTESHREIFGYNFWVDQVLPYIDRDKAMWASYTLQKYVISDVRFENEAARVRYYGGKIVEIMRPSLANVKDAHVSEQIPTPDFQIINLDNNMASLYTGIDEFMESEVVIR
jgi:hypothetical protein